MQYTDGIGIQITKPELAALVQFCGEADRLANVSIRVRDGKLIAWATDGSNAAYLHGESWDGKGKPSHVDHDWMLASEMAESIARAMGKDTEAILHANKAQKLFEAEVKEIESGKSLMKIDLDGHVSEQLDLSLPNYFPVRPPRDTGEVPHETQTFSFGSLNLLKKVCSAACTDVVKVFVNSNPTHPIYCEIATPQELNDDEQPRWICVLAPSSAAAEMGSGSSDSEDEDESRVARAVRKAGEKFKEVANDLGCKVTMTGPNGVTVKLADGRKRKGSVSEPVEDDED